MKYAEADAEGKGGIQAQINDTASYTAFGAVYDNIMAAKNKAKALSIMTVCSCLCKKKEGAAM